LYVKRYTVRRGDRSYVYLRLVSGYRDGQGRVQHRIVATLGREDVLKASGQLNQLAAAFARLDPPLVGTRREVGALLLAHHYLRSLGVSAIIDRLIPQRGRAELTTGEVVEALVANRLCAPSPLYDVAGWGTSAALQELFGIPAMLLNDDRLGRALEAFAPQAEAIRGAVALAAIQSAGVEVGRLHVDLTTLRVSGAYEGSSLVGRGWGADRKIARQVRMLQATNPEGVSLYVRAHPGDSAELKCIGAALESLVATLGRGLLICADSAFGNPKNLCEAHRAGLRFVVPLRAPTGFAQRYLDEVGPQALHRLRYVSRRENRLPAHRRTRYRGALRAMEVTDPETQERHPFRVAYVWSSEEARSVGEGRERALAKVEKELAKLQRLAGGRYCKTHRQLAAKLGRLLESASPVRDLLVVTAGVRGDRPTLEWRRDHAAIQRAAATDGIYALATNLPGRITATHVLRLYKGQNLVEQRHRDAKANLRVRPIFLHNDDRIGALVSIVGLALLVFGLIESDLRKALGPTEALKGLLPENRTARPTGRNILAAFQSVGITYTRDGLLLDRLTSTQRQILRLLKVKIPWPEQPSSTHSRLAKRAGSTRRHFDQPRVTGKATHSHDALGETAAPRP
jgi:transposase